MEYIAGDYTVSPMTNYSGLLYEFKEKEVTGTVRITIPEDLEYNGIFDDLFQTYTNSVRLERVKTINLGTMYELTYFVDLKDPAKEKEFIDALRCRNGNLTVIVTSVMRNKDDL